MNFNKSFDSKYIQLLHKVPSGKFWYDIECLLPLSKCYIVCGYIIQGVSLVISDTAVGVSYHFKIVTMSLNKEKVIKSPGYPHVNYERNTNYTWYLIARDDTEEIFMEITIDIHDDPGFPCYDYLQVCVSFKFNLVIELHIPDNIQIKQKCRLVLL